MFAGVGVPGAVHAGRRRSGRREGRLPGGGAAGGPPRLGPPGVSADGRSRYQMLETLRAYGAGLLAGAEEEEQAAAALAGYALQVAREAAGWVSGKTVTVSWPLPAARRRGRHDAAGPGLGGGALSGPGAAAGPRAGGGGPARPGRPASTGSARPQAAPRRAVNWWRTAEIGSAGRRSSGPILLHHFGDHTAALGRRRGAAAVRGADRWRGRRATAAVPWAGPPRRPAMPAVHWLGRSGTRPGAAGPGRAQSRRPLRRRSRRGGPLAPQAGKSRPGSPAGSPVVQLCADHGAGRCRGPGRSRARRHGGPGPGPGRG